MSKFFVEKEAILDNSILITGEDVSHIRKVLRAKIGEQIIVCDGNGWDYITTISSINDKEIQCDIVTKNLCEQSHP